VRTPSQIDASQAGAYTPFSIGRMTADAATMRSSTPRCIGCGAVDPGAMHCRDGEVAAGPASMNDIVSVGDAFKLRPIPGHFDVRFRKKRTLSGRGSTGPLAGEPGTST
jgi:hypothetical protein